ncbi:MAG: methyltransferase domain-containing protein [Candidatus Hydrogenedentes bacterium]|nr:methyltransferase domain-containing protein [Candidatus Hydrogenedentota bacterium]
MLRFLKEFVNHPAAIGAVAPSSRHLARKVAGSAGVGDASVVIEFGPGTGVITAAILELLRPDALFFALEINPEFVEITRKRFPHVTVHNDSAANARKYLEEAGVDSCQCIVSGLPWTTFDNQLQDTLLNTVVDVLAPGGRFATYTYLQSTVLPSGIRFRKKLCAAFGDLGITRPVWRNVPPAVVYYAQK